MLSEEKKERKNKKNLINTNVITRNNAVVISCDEQLWRSSLNFFKHFPIKIDDITIKI